MFNLGRVGLRAAGKTAASVSLWNVVIGSARLGEEDEKDEGEVTLSRSRSSWNLPSLEGLGRAKM